MLIHRPAPAELSAVHSKLGFVGALDVTWWLGFHRMSQDSKASRTNPSSHRLPAMLLHLVSRSTRPFRYNIRTHTRVHTQPNVHTRVHTCARRHGLIHRFARRHGLIHRFAVHHTFCDTEVSADPALVIPLTAEPAHEPHVPPAAAPATFPLSWAGRSTPRSVRRSCGAVQAVGHEARRGSERGSADEWGILNRHACMRACMHGPAQD